MRLFGTKKPIIIKRTDHSLKLHLLTDKERRSLSLRIWMHALKMEQERNTTHKLGGTDNE